jgi:hypothetical protein
MHPICFRNNENSIKVLAAEADICHCDPCRCHEMPTDCRGCSNEIMRLVNNTLDATTSQEQPPEKESPDVLEQNPLSLINSLCVTVEKDDEDFGDLPSITPPFSINDNYVALSSDSVLEGEGQLITSSTALLNADSSFTESSEPSAEELLENDNDLLGYPTAPLTEAESSPGIAVPVMFNASTGNFECIKTGGPQHSIAKVWRDSPQTVSNGCACGESKGKSPCCVVVCLKTLKQIKKAVKKGCCALKNSEKEEQPPDAENVNQCNGNVEAESMETPTINTSRQDSLLEYVEILDLPNSVFSLDIEEDGDEYHF